jgi:hypothetical protein
MKTNKIQRSTIRKIHSMHELQLEQARLKLELVRTEDKIKANYRHILSAFSLRNIFSTVTTELSSTSSVISKAFTLGKNLLARRKKKKKGSKAPEKTDEQVDNKE